MSSSPQFVPLQRLFVAGEKSRQWPDLGLRILLRVEHLPPKNNEKKVSIVARGLLRSGNASTGYLFAGSDRQEEFAYTLDAEAFAELENEAERNSQEGHNFDQRLVQWTDMVEAMNLVPGRERGCCRARAREVVVIMFHCTRWRQPRFLREISGMLKSHYHQTVCGGAREDWRRYASM